jgi:hypothetical protein
MRWTRRGGAVVFVLAAAVALTGAGCRNRENAGAKTGAKVSRADGTKKAHDHSGWWCAEHGVPEHECSLCLPEAEVKARFKDKGDWCQLHDRARSQCFKCDPALYEKYAAKYRARYNGKEPPRPPESEFQK